MFWATKYGSASSAVSRESHRFENPLEPGSIYDFCSESPVSETIGGKRVLRKDLMRFGVVNWKVYRFGEIEKR